MLDIPGYGENLWHNGNASAVMGYADSQAIIGPG